MTGIREVMQRKLVDGRKLRDLTETLRALAPTARIFDVETASDEMNVATAFVPWLENEEFYSSETIKKSKFGLFALVPPAFLQSLDEMDLPAQDGPDFSGLD